MSCNQCCCPKAGAQGPKGDKGEPFVIEKTFPSVAEMEADTSIKTGNFAIIASTTEDEDNGKLYVKTDTGYVFITDLSGSQGIQGPRGETGPQGIQGPRGDNGLDGANGKSTYQLWTEAGNVGSVQDFLNSLIGATGERGEQGLQGPQGLTGERGPQGERGLQGIQGPQGIQGDIGPVGPQGNQGLQGPIGLTGPKGDTGEKGETGSQGPTGLQGEQGPQGPVGIQGPVGPEGPRGPQGDIGLTGPQGPEGPQGIKGEKGDKGEGFEIVKTFPSVNDMNADTSVPEGKFVMITTDNPNEEDNAKLFVKSANGYTYISDLSGATGIVGPKGDKGDDGVNGKSAYELAVLNGFTGVEAQWLASLKGEKGDTGERGPEGAQGIQGLQGPRGEAGPVGPIGPEGPRGLQGETGAVGPQGPQGVQGLKGDTGERGLQGIQGEQGIKGEQGERGVGVQSSIVSYAKNTSGTTAPTSGFTPNIPELNGGEYLWSKMFVTYTDGTTSTMYSVSRAPDVGANRVRTYVVNMTHAQVPTTGVLQDYRKLTWNDTTQWGSLHLDITPRANVGNNVVIGNLPAGVPRPVSLIEAGVAGTNNGAGQVYINENGQIVANYLIGNRRYTVDLQGYYRL